VAGVEVAGVEVAGVEVAGVEVVALMGHAYPIDSPQREPSAERVAPGAAPHASCLPGAVGGDRGGGHARPGRAGPAGRRARGARPHPRRSRHHRPRRDHRALANVDVVVNCAAWTAVDAAETHEPQAFTVNAVGAANVARACAANHTRLVHISTDYVFDGKSATPYDEHAPTAPATAYGRTKLAGEWAARALHPAGTTVLRTAWLYGAHGPSFVRTMARVAVERGAADVVADQHGQPTWTADVASQVVALVEHDAPAGVYHATSSGIATWWELARGLHALRRRSRSGSPRHDRRDAAPRTPTGVERARP